MRCGTSVWRCTGRAVILLDLAPFPLRSIWGDGSPGPLAHTRFPQSRSIDRAFFRRALDILGRGPQRKSESRVSLRFTLWFRPLRLQSFGEAKRYWQKGSLLNSRRCLGSASCLLCGRIPEKSACQAQGRFLYGCQAVVVQQAMMLESCLWATQKHGRQSVFVLICPFEGGCLATQCMGSQGQ